MVGAAFWTGALKRNPSRPDLAVHVACCLGIQDGLEFSRCVFVC